MKLESKVAPNRCVRTAAMGARAARRWIGPVGSRMGQECSEARFL